MQADNDSGSETGMDWSARQYSLFEAERTRPVRDLLAGVSTNEVRRAVDIGCGPGNSTEVLSARYPEAQVTGLDSSMEMVEAARKRLPKLHFDCGEIAGWEDPGPFDVILANAVLQWLPDHATLLPKLIGKLAPGGSLAVQMPDNLDEPAHREMRTLAQSATWRDKLADAAKMRSERHTAEWYYRLLRPLCHRVDVWRTTYHHPMADHATLVEWFKGTGLRPYLALLTQGEQNMFLTRYESALAEAYPPEPGGGVLLPFPRLFFVATRQV